VVVGEGPLRADLARRFPDAVFLGVREGEELAAIYAAADVFVFPSRTDTFGLVMLEALASGVPVAAFPSQAARYVIGAAPVGVMREDLRAACLRAPTLSRDACRTYALQVTWEESARLFLAHVRRAVPPAPVGHAARAGWPRRARGLRIGAAGPDAFTPALLASPRTAHRDRRTVNKTSATVGGDGGRGLRPQSRSLDPTQP
jgi:hypothetical protein